MNNFIDSAKVFARMREVDPEVDFVRNHRRRLGLSRFDSRAQSQTEISMCQFCRQYFRILLERLTTMMGDNHRAFLVNFEPFCSLNQPPLNKRVSVADIGILISLSKLIAFANWLRQHLLQLLLSKEHLASSSLLRIC